MFSRVALRRSLVQATRAQQQRLYATEASDKLKLSLTLPHDVSSRCKRAAMPAILSVQICMT